MNGKHLGKGKYWYVHLTVFLKVLHICCAVCIFIPTLFSAALPFVGCPRMAVLDASEGFKSKRTENGICLYLVTRMQDKIAI